MYTRPRQTTAATRPDTSTPKGEATYPKACTRTLSELSDVVAEQDELRTRLKEAEQRIAVLRPLAVGLLSQCAEDDRRDLSQSFDLPGLLGELAETRCGDLLREVRDIFRASAPAPRGAGDVIEALGSRGMTCSSKAVYNAIQRLALSGQLVRVSRGRYLAPGQGFAIESSDDLLG